MSVEEVTAKTEQIDIQDASSAAAPSGLKHPLNTEWTLWYTKPKIDASEDWSSLLRPITKITSVEEFWGFYSCIPKASALPPKSDYHLFRNEIRPEWEDPANSKGGKWSVFISDSNKEVLDDLWLKLMLSSIGEILEDDAALANEITGVVFNCKKRASKLNVWTKSCDNEEVLKKIGLKLKTLINTKLTKEGVEAEQVAEQQQQPETEKIVLQFSKHTDARDDPPMLTL